MKRPLATAAMAFLAVTAVAFLLPFWVAAILAGCVVVFSLAKAANKSSRSRGVALAAAALALLALGLSGFSILRAARAEEHLAGQNHTATLLITDKDAEQNQYTAKVTEAGGISVGGVALRFYLGESYEVGDELIANVEFYGRSVGAGTLDETARFSGRVGDVFEVRAQKSEIIAAIFRFRSGVSELIRQMLPGDEGRLAAALVTGQKSQLTPDMQFAFQRAGVSHIVVVSGLHITVLLGLIYWFAKKLRARWLQFLLLVIAAGFLMLLYGLTPSVVRACAMSLVVYGGGMLLRKSDAPTTLALAATIILAVNPAAVLSASFLLSFGCCFAIMVVSPFVVAAANRRIKPENQLVRFRLHKFISAISVPLCITAVTFPVLVFFGMPVSLVSPLSNLVAVPLVPVLMVFAMLTAFFQWLLPFFALTNIVGFCCGLLARLILAVSSWFASWRFAAAKTTAPFLKWWVLFALALVVVSLTIFKKKLAKKLVAGALLLTLVCGWGSDLALSYNTPSAVLYNGEAVAVLQRKSAVVVVRQPSEKGLGYLKNYLQARFVSDYECVIITGKISKQTAQSAREMFDGVQLFFSFDYGIEKSELLLSGLPLNLGEIDIYIYPNATTIVKNAGVSLCFSADSSAPASGWNIATANRFVAILLQPIGVILSRSLNMAQLTDQTIEQSLEGSLGSFYVVAGDDAFVADTTIEKIAQAAGAPIERFDIQTTSREELQQVFFNVSLLDAARRVVLLDNLFSKALSAGDLEFYKAAFADLGDSLVVIARYIDEESRYFSVPKQASELANEVGGNVVKAMAKRGGEAAALIAKLAAEEGAAISREAVALLAELCGGDMMAASNEVKKLAALADYGEITKAHVNELAVKSAEVGVYDMLGKLERGDRKGAIGLLHEMLESKTEPTMISSVLNTAFINIYRAKLAQQVGLPEQQLFSKFNYRKGDKKVGVAFRQAKNRTGAQLERAIELLTQLDLELKSSPVDKPTLLEMYAAKLIDAI